MANVKPPEEELLCDNHANYLKRCLKILPPLFVSQDFNRLTIAFFAVSGLDLLNRLNIIDNEKDRIIEWIYSHQIIPLNQSAEIGCHGFRGSACNGEYNKYDCGNLAMTYCALSSLVILGDDLSRVNKSAIIGGLKDYQLCDGSFVPVYYEKENDMRFVYCATAVCYILHDWTGINVDKTVEFIKNSFSYESAFGQGPHLEAHGGSTYCAVAALSLMNKLHNTLTKNQVKSLKRWCHLKQYDGFEGRPNKDADTCYSFWIGAALKLLDSYGAVNQEINKRFILSTQDVITGGLAKYPDNITDPLHTYLGLSGLALASDPNLPIMPVNPALNISERAFAHLKSLHYDWSCNR